MDIVDTSLCIGGPLDGMHRAGEPKDISRGWFELQSPSRATIQYRYQLIQIEVNHVLTITCWYCGHDEAAGVRPPTIVYTRLLELLFNAAVKSGMTYATRKG